MAEDVCYCKCQLILCLRACLLRYIFKMEKSAFNKTQWLDKDPLNEIYVYTHYQASWYKNAILGPHKGQKYLLHMRISEIDNTAHWQELRQLRNCNLYLLETPFNVFCTQSRPKSDSSCKSRMINVYSVCLWNISGPEKQFLCSMDQHAMIIHSGWSLAYLSMKERINRRGLSRVCSWVG